MWPIRSFLFVPANRPSWVAKAFRCEPDAVILDVEDAVPHQDKAEAQKLLKAEIAELHAHGTSAFVRINPLDQGGAADVEASVSAGLTGIVLPKASNEAEVRDLHDLLSYWEGRAGLARGQVSILPIPETPQGLRDVYGLAKASPRVKGIMGGINGPTGGDISRAMGCRPTMDGTEQLYMNSKMVLDSRAAGAMFPVAAIIGTQLDDLGAAERLIRRAKDIGYTGAVLIHPSHVGIANAVMRPTDAEIAYNEGLLAAFAEAEASGQAAIRYQGVMVDYAMLPLAREIVAEAASRRARKS